jgi:PKD repeat protein
MKKVISALFLTILFNASFAQNWVNMMQDPNANFYDIQREFNVYWKDRPYERGHGYRAFKRWEWYMAPRVYPSGDMKLASRGLAYEKYQEFLAEQATNKMASPSAAISATTANWVPLGPYGSPTNGDAGRLQCVRFMPGNPSIVFVGTAAGGMWKTTNNGATWTTTTDQIASLGVSDIAINPLNTNIMYIATGDIDAGDTYATGILRSTDGGLTWITTGLTWTTSQQRRIGRLLINPLKPTSLIAATSNGMYKTIDGGTTWTQVAGGSFKDAEYKPNDTTVVYAVSAGGLIKSTNGGASFTSVTISSTLNSNRLSICVTPANANYVYILASNQSNGFGGLFRSTNSATSFSLMSSTPNIFDWSTNGSGSGGQGWYDIAIGASPTNADYIVAGGVNTWRSTNGGSTWVLNTHWTGSGGKPFVHADLHDVQWVNGSTIYLGHDGGISVSTNTNTSWTTINGNMNIAQIYRMGQSASASTPTYIIGGHQDNGTNLVTSGANWVRTMGGDGMDCFVSWANNNVMVGSQYNGSFNRTTNGGASWSAITSGLTGNAAWVAPIVQDPVTATTFYCGEQNVYKSTNQGSTWTSISPALGTIDRIAVAPSNNQVIYASAGANINRTTNGGTSWGSITNGLPNLSITDIAIDNQNSNNIWITMSGYSAGNKVFQSTNGGSTWINYSTGLPNIPANTIVYVKNSPKAMYVGTDVGVYYREASMSSWMPYFQGLPNINVSDLDIYYPTNKLRAATYARGVWQTDLYSNPTAPPFAYFSNQFSSACVGVPFTFNDGSSNSPTTWQWVFQGGSISTSTVQNPTVTFNTVGTYTASLIASNANGPSTPYIATITVSGPPTATANSPTVCGTQAGVITLTTNATNVSWSNGSSGNTISTNTNVTTVYTYSAYIGACLTTGNATLFVSSPPAVPNVLVNGNILSSSTTAPAYQWYFNGSPISGATSQTYQATASGWYSIWLDNGSGCQSSSQSVYWDITTDINQAFVSISSLQLAPNPVKEFINVQFSNSPKQEVSYRMVNTLGQVIKEGKFKVEANETIKISMENVANGVYDISFSAEKATKTYKFIKN